MKVSKFTQNLIQFSILEMIMFERSELYRKTLIEICENPLDDHGFSFSSIGDEFDFTTQTRENKITSLITFEESDLLFESSQSFY